MTQPPPPTGRPISPRWWSGVLPVRWGIPMSLVPWGVLAGTILLQLPILLGGRALGIRWQRDPTDFGLGVVSYALIALSIVLIVRRRGSGSLVRDLGFAFRPVDLAIGFGGFVAVQIVRLVLTAITVPLIGAPSHGNIEITSSPLWFVLDDVVLASLIAPLVEELTARGLFLRAIRNAVLRRGADIGDAGLQRRAAVLAVLVSSAVFTLAHLYEGWDDWRVVVYLVWTTLPAGLAAGWLAIVTRRLGAGIVLHVLVNLSASVIGFATLPR